MQIVTDSGTDLWIPREQRTNPEVHVVPLAVTLDGHTYREGLDIETQEFYRLLAASQNLPITSQPSAGDFAAVYRQLAAHDPEILSIHISSGLSGTVNAAQAGAQEVPEAHVTVVDTKTLSVASGWQVEAAWRAARAGWDTPRTLELLARISDTAFSLYTLRELKYLIHGGRISHMKGLVASVLNIKPIIGVEREFGKYVQMGQARTFNAALEALAGLMAKQYSEGSKVRAQVMNSNDPAGAELLRQAVDRRFDCTWLPMMPISLVLGAHTGPSLVAAAIAPMDVIAEMP